MENTSSPGVMLYYFRANWCKTCSSFDPTYSGVVSYGSTPIKTQVVDIDQEKDLVSKYQITSVPTILVVQNDTVMDRIVGEMSTKRLNLLIGKYK
jgi:thioredoxin 1